MCRPKIPGLGLATRRSGNGLRGSRCLGAGPSHRILFPAIRGRRVTSRLGPGSENVASCLARLVARSVGRMRRKTKTKCWRRRVTCFLRSPASRISKLLVTQFVDPRLSGARRPLWVGYGKPVERGIRVSRRNDGIVRLELHSRYPKLVSCLHGRPQAIACPSPPTKMLLLELEV